MGLATRPTGLGENRDEGADGGGYIKYVSLRPVFRFIAASGVREVFTVWRCHAGAGVRIVYGRAGAVDGARP